MRDLLEAGGTVADLVPVPYETKTSKTAEPANDTAPSESIAKRVENGLARNKHELPRVERGKDIHRVLDDLDEALADSQTGDQRLYQRSRELVIARERPSKMPNACISNSRPMPSFSRRCDRRP